jgi:hypothetical protein
LLLGAAGQATGIVRRVQQVAPRFVVKARW